MEEIIQSLCKDVHTELLDIIEMVDNTDIPETKWYNNWQEEILYLVNERTRSILE